MATGAKLRGRSKEQTASYGVEGGSGVSDTHDYVTAQVPDQVLATGETGHRAGIQQCAMGIQDIDLFRPSIGSVEVERVKGNLVCLSVREVQIDRENPGGIPAARHTDSGGGQFQWGADVDGGSGPEAIGIGGGSDGDIRGIGSAVADDVGTLAAVHGFPGALCRGVGLDEDGRAKGRCDYCRVAGVCRRRVSTRHAHLVGYSRRRGSSHVHRYHESWIAGAGTQYVGTGTGIAGATPSATGHRNQREP